MKTAERLEVIEAMLAVAQEKKKEAKKEKNADAYSYNKGREVAYSSILNLFRNASKAQFLKETYLNRD